MDEKDDIKLIGYKEVDESYLKRKRNMKIRSTTVIVLCIISQIIIGTILGTLCGIFVWQNFCN